MIMKVKPFALAAAAVLFTTPVWAADLSSSYQAPTYNDPVPSSGWGGAYVGGDIGVSGRKIFSGDKGVALGVHGGYNIDLDSGVVGGELDVSHQGNSEMRVPGGDLKTKWRIAAKAKAGIGVNNNQTLVYGTGGFTVTDYGNGGGAIGPDGWKPGYLLGAGVEHKLSDNLSARVEYNYVGTNNVRSVSGGVASKTDLHDNTIKAGVNYKF